MESGLPAASGNSVELRHVGGRGVRRLGVGGSFNGRSGNSVVSASQKIWFDYFVNTWFESLCHSLILIVKNRQLEF